MMERTRLGRLMSWRFGLLLVLGVALGLFLFDRFVLWPWLTRDASQVADLAEARLKNRPLRAWPRSRPTKRDARTDNRNHRPEPPPKKQNPSPFRGLWSQSR